MDKSDAVGILFWFNGIFCVLLSVALLFVFNVTPIWLGALPAIIWAVASLLIFVIWVNVVCIKELLKDYKNRKK